jgi:hypothetical protein
MKQIIFQVEGGLGKNIAATSVIKGIAKTYPDHNIIVLSPFSFVFLNNPDVYRVYNPYNLGYFYDNEIKNNECLYMHHNPYHSDNYINGRTNLIKTWFDIFNLQHENEQPSIYLTAAEIQQAKFNYISDKPIFVIQPNTQSQSLYNWNRDIPPSIVNEIILNLKDKYTIYHIGTQDQLSYENTYKPVLNEREIFTLLQISEGRILTDSSCQHASAALNLSSTVCWVDTNPTLLGYNMHRNFIAYPPNNKIHTHNFTIPNFNFTGQNLTACPWDNMDNIFNVEAIIAPYL